jgi:regulatory protein
MGPRTRGQLETVLRRRDVAPEVATEVLDRLEGVALVDDAAFSENYVRTRHAGRGLARRAIGHELRGKGVSDAVVSDALESLDPEDELATARGLVDRRLASTRRFDVEVRTRRLVGMLARKGYPGGLAMRVVREALAGERELDELESAFLGALDVELSDAARLGE